MQRLLAQLRVCVRVAACVWLGVRGCVTSRMMLDTANLRVCGCVCVVVCVRFFLFFSVCDVGAHTLVESK